MPMISVKAVDGRVARRSPRGAFISHQKFVMVENTNYIQRLLHVHKDLIEEPKKAPAPVKPELKPETKPEPKPKAQDSE